MEFQTVAALVAAARDQIQHRTPAELSKELAAGGVTVVDIREASELAASGAIPGAVHAPRGMLEFYADPVSPYHRAEFDPAERIVLYCASGGRSALAAATLQQLGYTSVAHLDGGLAAWIDAGQPVEPI